MSPSRRSCLPPCCCGRAYSATPRRSPQRRPISVSKPTASFSAIRRSGWGSDSSGVRRCGAVRRGRVPLGLAVMFGGFVLVILVRVRELPSPLVLYSQDNVGLSVLLGRLVQSGEPAPAAAIGSIIIAVILP